MKKNNKNKFSFINNFPLIIMVVVAIVIVSLVNIYLSFKPYDTIYQNGYMVLSNNMAYNLINNNTINDTLNVGVVSVNNGDSIYKQIDSYYVGEETKKEIDYGYPIYSSDGLTIHTINDEFTLVNRNFEILDGYPGLSLNYGFIYNEGEEESADNIDYLFMKLKNSIFINSQVMNIQTKENEYNIPVNSPMYFNVKYINYYTFDGQSFNYNRISDIEYETLIKIGDVSVTYEELLLKMDIVKKIDIEEDKENKLEEDFNQSNTNDANGIGDGIGTGTGNGSGAGNGTGSGNGESNEGLFNEIFGDYVEPTVTADSLVAKTYSVTLNVVINDPSGVITSGPTFEIYTSTGKLYSRKKIMISGQLKMTGLSASTEYKIIGKYTYKDEFGLEITKNIYEKNFKTEGVDGLETIKISSQTGSRYSNKIEIKDFTVLNPGIETLNGVKRITIQTWKENDPNEVESSNISTSLLKKILKGEATTIQTYPNLQSNTVYNYKILFYDKNNNILNLDGKSEGVIKTAPMAPTISSGYSYDYENNSISATITTNNIDNISISEYKYKFYKTNGEILYEDKLDYRNKETKKLKFENLVYETEYYLQITGTYDLEDGNGEVKINKMVPSKTPFYLAYPSAITAWYYSSQLKVTENSIKTNVYISKKANVLSKDNGFVRIFLEDNNGNVIEEKVYVNKKSLDGEQNETLYYQENTSPNSYFIENLNFENLVSDTEYTIKVSVGLLNQDNENGIDFETDKYIVSYPITTNKQEAYVEVLKKVLYNDKFIFEYKIVDKDNDIGNKIVRIDVYEKDCSNNSCTNLYKEDNIYGQQLDLSKKNEKGEIIGAVQSDDYYSDNYTITISAMSKNSSSSRKYIKVKENNTTDVEKKYISLKRNINLSAQMKSQTVETTSEIGSTGKKLEDTTSYFQIMNVDENIISSLAFYDCSDDGKQCFSIQPEDINLNNSQDYVVTVKNKSEFSKKKQFYVIMPKENYKDESGMPINIEDVGDVLYSIDYTTNKNIYEIASEADFLDLYVNYNKSIEDKYPEIDESNGTVNGNYVVTNDLKLVFPNGVDKKYYLKNLSGVLDFQGHSITLNYDNGTPYKHFIHTIGGSGTLKNVEFKLNFNFESSYDTVDGIIYYNYGTVEDVIINMYQENSIPMVYNGFIYYNRPLQNSIGTLNRFIVYLHSDIYTDGYSSLAVYSNAGIVKNGYISTHPDKLSNGSKNVYVTRFLGLAVWDNFKTIKNVYNLVNVRTLDNSKQLFGTLLYYNRYGGVIENTFSVSQTSTINDNSGPNIYRNDSNAINNYYVDINKISNSYSYDKHPYNIPMEEYLLTNTFFMDSLINSENQFKISTWYYPTLNLSNFMQFKQKNLSLNYESDAMYVGLSLATSAEDDVRKKITQEGLSPDQKTNKYQTSKIKLYFNNPSLYTITKIKMEKGVIAQINTDATEIDSLTGMTVLDVDLTLTTGGVAKSSYNIEEYCYCYSSDCVYNPRTRCVTANKKVSVDVFQEVKDYGQLVDAINKNQNILITENIDVKKWLDQKNKNINSTVEGSGYELEENFYINLPRNADNLNKVLNYSAKIYGVVDEKNEGIVIDFNNVDAITRGYFIPQFSGSLKNIQVRNLSISSSNENIGFIKNLNNAKVENVDISDSKFNYLVNANNKNLYVGTLASISNNLVSITKTSSNNNTISPDANNNNNNIVNSYIGGLVSWMSETSVSNSYVYNVDVSDIFIDMEIGKLAIGGLTAYTTGGQINNVYTTGNIESNYSNIGGIVGSNADSHIENSYSYMNIFSTGRGIGGIAGIQQSLAYNYYRDVMFIGNIEGSSNYSYLLTTDLSSNTVVLYNGYVFSADKVNNADNGVMIIPFYDNNGNTIKDNNENYNFEIFDQTDSFIVDYGENYLPYLKETSFVAQKIKSKVYRDLSEKITITVDYNNNCQDNLEALGKGSEGLCYDSNNELNGYATEAIISLNNSYCIYSNELNVAPKGQNNSNSNSEKSCVVSSSGEYTVTVPEKGVYKDYYILTIIDEDGSKIEQKTYLPFYRDVGKKYKWNDISTKENENIYITADIYLNESDKSTIVNKRINNLIGGKHKISGNTITDNTTTDNDKCIVSLKENPDADVENYKTNCLESITGNKNSRLELTSPLINSVTNTMKNISFENFEVVSDSEVGAGLILFNGGTLSNNNNQDSKIMFKNIKVSGNNKVGIIALNSGYIDNVDVEDVYVSGIANVGGLVAYDNTTDTNIHINNVNAKNVYAEGMQNVGGVHGYSSYYLKNIKTENFYINYKETKGYTSKGNMGGVIGKGECADNCSAFNGVLVVNGNYIGGVLGVRSTKWSLSSTEARNIVIQNATPNAYSTHVGGITGYHDGFSKCYVENLNLFDSFGKLGSFSGREIGGAAGSIASSAVHCYVKNSNISGVSSVGGVVGYSTYGSNIQKNVVSNVTITATSSDLNKANAGGIIGQMLTTNTRGTPIFNSNLVYNVDITGYANVGGIIGFFDNSIASYQGASFKSNIIVGLKLTKSGGSLQNSFGGIIGKLYQVPNSSQKLFENSIYTTSNDYNPIGIVSNLSTGAGGNGFSNNQSLSSFLEDLSSLGFKKVDNSDDIIGVFGEASNTIKDSLNDNINLYTGTVYHIKDKDTGNYYFPVPIISSWKDSSVVIPRYTKEEFVIEPSEFVDIPGSNQEVASFSTRKLMMARRVSSSASQDNVKEPLDLEVYTTDVNKINIDFSGIDEDSNFYYQIGNYVSPLIPVVNRTFTITYDFKESIKIILDSGGELITKIVKPSDLIRTISYVNDKVYYIENGILYSEDKVITGNFINLYDNKVLTTGGMIYNIITKEEIASNVDYKLQYSAKPLYSFEYNGSIIETYYNYSIYNSIIKDYQIILKNGLINVVDSTIDNKKNSYIIDLYNNNEIQIILKNDGILYSLKGNIKYPSDFDNKNIKDLYTNLNSTNNIAVIRYKSGEVYAFNYLTGEKLFTNFSTENIGFFDYISNKLNNNLNNSIVNLVPMEEYKEINLLKGKLSDISITDANNKLNNNNSPIPEKKSDYISVYNDVTGKYDIYKTENILNSVELDPETEKINRDYELIQFYETLNDKEKHKSLSGIIIFTISIVAILLTLYKLIRRRKVRV